MKITMNDRMKKAGVVAATVLLMGGATGLGVVAAQGPTGGGLGGFAGPGRAGGGAALACSTTNYTDVAAKALGIESAALRQALVSGKSLQDIATSKNVPIATVEQALQTARAADVAQAVKDGLMTQNTPDQPGQVNPPSGNSNATPDATKQANQDGQGDPNDQGNQLPPRPGGPRGIRVPEHNVVNQMTVAAKALNMSCVDLVKALQTGQSIAQVATAKNVQAQSVIDALVTAYKAAIAQDVQEGLTAQAAADGQIAQVINRAGAFVYNQGRDRGPGGFGGRGPGGIGQPGDQPDGQPDGAGLDNPPQNGNGRGILPNGNNNGQGVPQATQSANTSS